MKVIPYEPKYHDAVYRLWGTSGVRQGFAPLEPTDFDVLLLGHKSFQPEYAFVLSEDSDGNLKDECDKVESDSQKICGFISGCLSENVPEAADAGFYSCLLLDSEYDTLENTRLLLNRLEDSFRKAGRKKIMCSYFNPIRLPWVIPGTKNCQHNNAPGIAVDLPLYERMQGCGYHDRVKECAMYLDLSGFEIPERVKEKEKKALKEGYSVVWYDSKKHVKLREMVDSMHNSMWSAEMPYAAEHINMLVAVKGNAVVGITGPVYPEKTGRGYFAGIAVSAEHEKHGLGTLLFYRLCLEEKKAGSAYMSLFTGESNHAQRIYKAAGFEVRRIFSVMEKGITDEEAENGIK